MKNILIVDDVKNIREALSDILTKADYIPFTAKNGTEAERIILKNKIDAVLLDIVMPEEDGMNVLLNVKKIAPNLPVIMLTAYGSIENAVKAVKLGAYDFIEKPPDADKILVTLKNAIEKHALSEELLQLRNSILEQYKIIGISPQISEVKKKIRLLAPQNCEVLITGESGTGKELVARALHSLSPRVSKPMIKVNCAALPGELIESELFGHKKGAYTGAASDNIGKIRAAEGGTLFLDEIGELPLSAQAKLLQVLEEKKFIPVGEVKEVSVDVRIISATNKNLQKEVEEKRFRRDLYYRLNTTEIHIPPLRERKEDIIELTKYFISKYAAKSGTPAPKINPRTLSLFWEQDWRGNARELKHKIEEIIIFSLGDEITEERIAQLLKTETPGSDNGADEIKTNLRRAKEKFEKEYIANILTAHDWKINEAAAYLGVERTNLYRKIKQLGIEKK